jgi:hypothetical protein
MPQLAWTNATAPIEAWSIEHRARAFTYVDTAPNLRPRQAMSAPNRMSVSAWQPLETLRHALADRGEGALAEAFDLVPER